MWRTYSFLTAKNAACGPPNPSGTPKRCELPSTASAPISPGGLTSASASRSVATATSTPAACARAMNGSRSSTSPASSGYCSSAPNVTASNAIVGRGSDPQLDAERLGAAPQHGDRLRKAAIRDQEHARLVAQRARLDAMQERHRLPRRRPLVQQRRVGHCHPRQVGDHGLEVEERFEAALRDLGLVRRVGRVPARVLEQAAADRARRQRVVVAEADEAARDLVPARDRPQAREVLRLALRGRQRERRLQANARRQRFVDERVERGGANRREHGPRLVRRRADVAGSEMVDRFQIHGS